MIEKTGNDLVVIASDPQELADSQLVTIKRVREKLVTADEDVKAAEEVIASCEAANISPAAGKRLLKRAKSRALYLNKVVAALEAGCVIVPNMPGDTVAIRVIRSGPRGKAVSSYSKRSAAVSAEKPDELPVGEGRYVDPQPFQQTQEYKPDPNKNEIRYRGTPTELDEEIALPVEFLKPTVVARTGIVMQRRIFDEIAVIGGRSRNRDPLVVGRIFDFSRRRGFDNEPMALSFLIAWFVPLAEI